jgi:uncharacterized protein involved in outer membrane biogenesis
LVAALAAFCVAGLLVLGRLELAPLAERYVPQMLGRPITVGTLRVHWGVPVTVELRDLAIDNAPGGSQARMLRITRLDADIAPLSLVAWAMLGHPPLVRHLTIDGARLLLEHAAGDRPNWRFGQPQPNVVVHRNPRTGFPTLLDARLHDVEIDVRTSTADILRIRLDKAGIGATGVDRPVSLTAAGAYNGTPITLSAALHSFAELHDRSVPFGADIRLASGDTTLDFAGTLTDPIDVDGAVGRLTLKAPNLDQLLAVAGVGGRAALPLELAGALTREGNAWKLSDGQGTLVAHPFQASFKMQEGARRAPDDMTLDANFSVLDLTALASGGKPAATSLRVDDQPGSLLEAHVGAKQFALGKVRADDVDLDLNVAPGSLTIKRLGFHLAGGSAQVAAAVKNAKSSADLQFDAALNGADTGQLSRLAGVDPMPLSGAVDAHASLRLSGNTLQEASPTTSGTVVLSMRSGAIERKIVERVSTDLRLLFGKTQGTARIACALGVLALQDGVGRLAPLRIRTADGTLAAAGTIDLRRDAVDLTVASEAGSTSLFALDVPLHIVGPIRSPHVSPALGTAAAATHAVPDLRDLPAALQQVVRGDPCLAAGR